MRLDLLPRASRRIGVRIFLSFSSLLVGVALLFSVIGLQFAEKMYLANAENDLKVQSIVLSRLVQQQLDRIEAGLTSLESHGYLVEQLRKPQPDKAALEEFLRQRLALLTHFEDLALYNKNGVCIGATDPAWYNRDGRDQPFFIIKNPSGFAFTYLFTEDEGRVQLASVRITDGSVVRGVLVGQVDMSSLYNVMDQKLGVSESTDAFLVDSALRFITPGKTGNDRLLESHLIATPLQQHLKNDFWVDRYKNFNGQDVLGTAMRVPGGHKWYVVVERDLAEVTRPVDDATKLIFGATLALVVALVVLTYFVTRSITRPLMTLVEGAQRVAKGDLSHPFAIPRGTDEIAFLATEMDKMRAKVRTFQESIMERLEESEKKRLESERLAAIGTLASTLAHEIRNPLNAMSLLLSRLEHANPGNNPERRSMVIRDLRGEIGRLDRLVSDILDYARPLNLQYKDIDLRTLLDSTLELYRALFEGKRIQCNVAFPAGTYRLRVDPDRVKQCFVNVLQNAVEATPAGGHIDVDASRVDGMVEIVIRDDGIGLPAQPEGRLFDLFFTTKETGTGLGLSTVKKIVDAHGGQISLGPRTDHGARGAEVRMSFPQDSHI